MDFFARQEQAHRNTKLLVVYFVLAVVLLIVAVYFAVLVLFVGAKLKEAALKAVIENGEKIRPYMHANMPKFGAANVGQLVGLLTSADAGRVPEAPKVDVEDSDKKFKASGRFLVGHDAQEVRRKGADG